MEAPLAVDPTKNKIDGMDRYVVENAARVLVEAESIKSNPRLLKAARKIIKQTLKSAAAVG
jgi:hypothetical protein|tara:strand:+ start:2040 stop:2222 length:183 start_codon:yes stop_codon:yes gene_type:complete